MIYPRTKNSCHFFKMTNPVFDSEFGSKVSTAKLLVVGAGGIGCELLKNLVLTGFKDITVVSCTFQCWVCFSRDLVRVGIAKAGFGYMWVLPDLGKKLSKRDFCDIDVNKLLARKSRQVTGEEIHNDFSFLL